MQVRAMKPCAEHGTVFLKEILKRNMKNFIAIKYKNETVLNHLFAS